MNFRFLSLFVVLILIASSSHAQTFPGGVRPFEDRISVQDKLPPSAKVYIPGTTYQDDDSYRVSVDISVNGIQLKNVYCFFKGNKLTSMTYEFEPSDRAKIIELLKAKYKPKKCDESQYLNCYRGKNMTIEVAAIYMNYRSENQSQF